MNQPVHRHLGNAHHRRNLRDGQKFTPEMSPELLSAMVHRSFYNPRAFPGFPTGDQTTRAVVRIEPSVTYGEEVNFRGFLL